MLTWTRIIPVARSYVRIDDYNWEASAALAEFNGALSAEQLPYESFDAEKFVNGDNLDGKIIVAPGGATGGTGQRMATSTYAQVASNIFEFDAQPYLAEHGVTYTTLGPPQVIYSLADSTWSPGINPLGQDVLGSYLRTDFEEGLLKGHLNIDFEFYLGELSVFGTGSGLTGRGWTWQLYIYVDGVMIARTGTQPAGKRLTVALPFTTPIGKGSHTIEAKFKASYDQAGQADDYYYSTDFSKIRIYNAQLWVRGQHR